jgi:hypothetical protein
MNKLIVGFTATWITLGAAAATPKSNSPDVAES